MTRARSFLTAEWRTLVMLNYELDPAALADRVPAGCELDVWDGRTFVSVVGFRFLRTRVLGVAVPLHQNFDEVNLRFYVRRKAHGVWRRGVVFVREIVPRWAIALVANRVYGENYVTAPMRHDVEVAEGGRPSRAAYCWKRRGGWESVSATFSGEPTLPDAQSEESFITEHYWGYAGQRDGSTVEYEVEHPPWRVWRAESSSLECDAEALYGPEYREALSGAPSSAFVAEGSPIVVRRGSRLL